MSSDSGAKRPRTEARAAASRANGAHSRGPTSAAGKARSRLNALKHGLCTDLIVLPGESQQGYNDLRRAYYGRFQPADLAESAVVDLMVKLDWQIGRATVDERNVVYLRMEDQRERFDREFVTAHPSVRITRARQVEMQPGQAGDLLDRHLNRLDRAFNRALQRLHYIRTRFPLPQDQPESDSQAPAQDQTLNSWNEPEPPPNPVESIPLPASEPPAETPAEPVAESVAEPRPHPVRPVRAFGGYVIELPRASGPESEPETPPETVPKTPKWRCAA